MNASKGLMPKKITAMIVLLALLVATATSFVGCSGDSNDNNHICSGAAATCTTPQTCTECGKELAPALGHSPREALVFDREGHWNACANGCKQRVNFGEHTIVEETSETTITYKCSVCAFVDKTEKKPASTENTKDEENHNHTPTIVFEGDCVTEGYYKYNCPVCGVQTVDTGVDPNKHMGPFYEVSQIDKNTVLFLCEACDEEVEMEHNHEITDTFEGDCVNSGWQRYDCPICDEVVIYTGKKADNHKGPFVTETNTAKDRIWFVCYACEKPTDKDHGHVVISSFEGTCSADSWYKYQCDTCGTRTVYTGRNEEVHEGPFREDSVIHNDLSWCVCESCKEKVQMEHYHRPAEEIEGTCVSNGWIIINCPICGVKSINEGIDDKNHVGPLSPESGNGRIWYVCDTCGNKVDR